MFVKFPSINSLNAAVVEAEYHELGEVGYQGKVKLHGTNAAVTVDSAGRIWYQKRSGIVTPGPDDNAGFAAWASRHEDYWSSLCDPSGTITIYGEWAGPGVQKGVAVSEIPEKIFAVFAIQRTQGEDDGMIITRPSRITTYLHTGYVEKTTDPAVPSEIHVLPWYNTDIVFLDFSSRAQVSLQADRINESVLEVEANDPWIKSVFDIDGTGEGIVYYPTSFEHNRGHMTREEFKRFSFKAKGEKHRVVKSKKAATVDPEIAASIDAFAEQVVTDARLEQALQEGAQGKIDKRQIGPFIGWLSKDVKKDVDNKIIELPDGIDWKQANSAVVKVARDWYIQKTEII